VTSIDAFTFGILLYALLFAGLFYPLIPASLGGGRPRTIIFIPAKDGLPIGIVKDNASGEPVPYKLLEVTDRSYVVISANPNEVLIEIDRDAVQGMIVVNA
jgi:hypothetical protein